MPRSDSANPVSRREFTELASLAVLGAVLPGRAAAASPRAFALEERTIAQLQDAMKSGRLTARGLTKAYLDRIAALDRKGPTLRAVLETNPDALAIADIDNDGDIDLVAGNLGKNNPFRISEQQPAKLIALDFDNNGVPEPIFCYFIKDNNLVYKESVGISRDQWAMQSPMIKKKFLYNQPFASAAMQQIISPEEMARAAVLICNEVRSGYFENDGNGKFTFHPFELQAQFAPVNTILVADVDRDGKKDILLAGNEYEYNVAVGRMDASYGLMLKGDGRSEEHTSELQSQ